MSASESKRNGNTCMPRADGGTRADALWPLRILSPLSLLFSFFFYTRNFTCPPPLVFTRPRNRTSQRTYTRRESPWAIDSISSRFRSRRRLRSLRSVPRVRGKRRRVQHLPTSVMQLAFNPHSQILELNSTVCHETGSCTDVVIARIPEFIISLWYLSCTLLHLLCLAIFCSLGFWKCLKLASRNRS